MNFQAVVVIQTLGLPNDTVSTHWFATLEEVLAFVETFNNSKRNETVLAMYNNAY
jgi:hypothetical protein